MLIFKLASEWSFTSICIRLLFSMIMGVIIGIDRELKRRGAGIKTHTLVCLGSALVMITSEYMLHQFPDAKIDIARLGAQVISGVGFLGVGCILVTGRNQIRGLTTAAGLWTCACLGLAAGIGFLEGALAAFFLVIITYKVFAQIDMVVNRHARVVDCYVEFTSNRDIASFLAALHEMNLNMDSFDMTKSKIKGEGPTAIIRLELQDAHQKKRIIDELRDLDSVRYIEQM